jgi:hypothetical protein
MQLCGKSVHVTGRLLRLAALEADGYESLLNPDEMIDALRRSGERTDLFTFMEVMPYTEPRYRHFMEWDNFAVLPVSTFDNWWTHQIGFKARNKAKQAGKKGVTVREVAFDDNLARGISEIYNECPIRQGRPFAHYGKSIAAIHQITATFLESSIFVGAYFNDDLIGFAKLIVDQTGTQAGTVHLLSKMCHRDKAPTNALIAEIVRICEKRGISYFVYSKFAYGNKSSDSLSDFKESNGFSRINLPRYYVPLTMFGSAALRMGLHRGVMEMLPMAFITKARQYRNSWYNRRLQARSEMS